VHSLRAVYLATNPLVSAIAFSGALAGLLFIAAEINRNYSQIDRFWSILPALYNVHFALWARLSGIQTQTLDTIAVVTVVWSVSFAFLSSLYMY
jgi:steroid 5-alpha reductase family enzyme